MNSIADRLYENQKDVIVAHFGAMLDVARADNPHADFTRLVELATTSTAGADLNEVAEMLDQVA